MKLQVGQALISAVDTTTVIVTRAPEGDAVLTCGGAEMAPKGDPAPDASADPDQMTGTLLGKRYVDEAGTIEVLCSKGGDGGLAIDGRPLSVQDAKPLPSSD